VKDHTLQSILFNRISLMYIIIYYYKYIKIFFTYSLIRSILCVPETELAYLQWM